VLEPLADSSWRYFNIAPGIGTLAPSAYTVSLGPKRNDILCAKSLAGRVVELKRNGDRITPLGDGWHVKDREKLYNWFDVGTHASLLGRCRGSGVAYDGPFHFMSSSGVPGKEIPRVSRGLHQRPNIAPQGDKVYWHIDGRLHASGATGCLAEISSSDVTLLSGDSFGFLVTCRDGELDEIYLFGRGVSKEVSKLVGFPPIFGRISSVECSFCESTAWLFITAQWSSQKIRYVLVVDASGKLYGMGATAVSSVAWHSEGILLAAYHKKVGSAGERGLLAVVGDKLMTIVCRDQKVAPVSYQTCSSSTSFERILVDEEKILLE
jgi:hypothetical protein